MINSQEERIAQARTGALRAAGFHGEQLISRSLMSGMVSRMGGGFYLHLLYVLWLQSEKHF
jgi:hypothetical protein